MITTVFLAVAPIAPIAPLLHLHQQTQQGNGAVVLLGLAAGAIICFVLWAAGKL